MHTFADWGNTGQNMAENLQTDVRVKLLSLEVIFMAIRKDSPQKAAMREMMSGILEGALDEELDEELGYSKMTVELFTSFRV